MISPQERIHSFSDFPDWLLKKWQEIADLLAGLLHVQAALIMQVDQEFVQVFLASRSEGNPYHAGDTGKWNGQYCETVIKTQNSLLVADATQNPLEDKNPDGTYGMVATLGFPINFPNHVAFGTLCVLDKTERHFSEPEQQLLLQFKQVLELDLALSQSFKIQTDELAQTITDQTRKAHLLSATLNFVAKSQGAIDECLTAILDLIPSGWANPEGVWVKIAYMGKQFISANFRDGGFMYSCDIMILGKIVGTLEVGCLEKKTSLDAEPKLSEDEQMLSEIANQIGILVERKQAEQKYRLLAEISPDIIYIIDLISFKTVYLNRDTLLGYTLDELEAAGSILSKVHPDDLAALQTHWQDVFKSLNSNGYEYRIKLKDGRWEWVSSRERILSQDANGKPTQLLVTLSIITDRKQAEDALKRNETLLNEVQAISKVGGWDYDIATRKVIWTDEVYDIYGVGRDQDPSDISMAVALYAPEDQPVINQAFQAAVNTGQPYDLELRLDNAQGKRVWVRTSARPVYEQGRLVRLVGNIMDITQFKHIEAAEREQRTLAEALRDTAAAFNNTLQIEEVLDCIINNVERVVPHDASCIMLIQAAGQIAQVVRCHSTKDADYRAEMQGFQLSIPKMRNLREIAATGAAVIVADTHTYSGWVLTPQSQWIRATIGVPIKIRGETIGILAVYSSLPGTFTPADANHLLAFADQAAIAIENARLYEEVQELAITDALTGAFNRRGLVRYGEREVEQALRFQRPLSIVMVDLDHFKRINDTFGHPTGDRVLKAVTESCRAHVRSVDMVARYGGEEFILLLTETDAQSALHVAERLRKSVEKMLVPAETEDNLPGSTAQVTISLGVVSLNEDTRYLSDLLTRVDQALYAAKQAGRNRVFLGK